MNFAALREFAKNRNATVGDVSSYLSNELSATIRELRTGLLRLSFKDNFESFERELTIPVSTEIVIENELGSVPSGYVILRKNRGAYPFVMGMRYGH